MPDPDEGVVDPNAEGATALADDPGAAPQPEPEGGDGTPSPNDDPFHGKSREDVIAMLNAEKESGAKMAELQGKVDALLATRKQEQEPANDQPTLDDRLAEVQSKFNDEWAEKIAEDDTGKASVAFMQGAMAELAELFRTEIAATRGELGRSLFETSPEYQANKKQVDGVAKSAGISKQAALDALKHANVITSKTSQPGTVKAPGRTSDAGTAPATPAATPVKLSGFERNSVEGALRSAGYSDKDIAAEITKMEGELAQSAGGAK